MHRSMDCEAMPVLHSIVGMLTISNNCTVYFTLSWDFQKVRHQKTPGPAYAGVLPHAHTNTHTHTHTHTHCVYCLSNPCDLF